MQSKRVLSTILLVNLFLLHQCANKGEIKLPPGNAFVLLKDYEGQEYFTIFFDLDVITPTDFTKSDIGKNERLDFLSTNRKITKEEIEKLKKMGNLYLVSGNQNFDVQRNIDQNITKDNLLKFLNIPDNQKGAALKYLFKKGYYVVFKEYRGDYEIVPKH